MHLEFDRGTKTLTIKKLDIPEMEVHLIDELKESYYTYRTKTIYEDIKYLAEKIQEVTKTMSVIITPHVNEEPSTRRYFHELTEEYNKWYEVTGDITVEGIRNDNVLLLRIPYMDEDGILNYKGKRRALLQELKPLEDVTYDSYRKTLNITMRSANIAIMGKAKGFSVRHGSGKYNIIDGIVGLIFIEFGIRINLKDILQNCYLKRTLKLNDFYTAEAAISNLIDANVVHVKETGLDELGEPIEEYVVAYNTPMYSLGDTRDALNAIFRYDERILNKRLSRPLLNYEAGTKITEQMIKEFKRNRINELYIEDTPSLQGLLLAEESMLILDVIPKGAKVCKEFVARRPALKNLKIVPADMRLEVNEAIIYTKYASVTDEMVECMRAIGRKSIICVDRRGNGDELSENKQEYTFEREIIGNYTFQLGELVDTIPEDRSFNEWVFVKDNPNLEKTDMDHLNGYDMLALLSLLGEMAVTGQNYFMNRDTSFLRSINLVNDTFSTYLRKAINEFCMRDARTALNGLILGKYNNNDKMSPFRGLTHKWMKLLREATLLRKAETLNAVTKYTQVSRVLQVTQNAKEVAKEVRLLSIGHFGRIDPYETPAGPKLGLLNTRALGSKVVDRQVLTPYRKVVKSPFGKPRVSKKVEYLSSKKEMLYKIGDLLELDLDSDWTIKTNAVVAARVPNNLVSDERVLVNYVNTYDLDYVTAYPEQSLAPSSMMIPYMGMDDSIRGTYALNMLRQSIYTVKQTAPRTITPFYRNIYSDVCKYLIRAEDDGVVVDIVPGILDVQYIHSKDITSYPIDETIITKDSITFLSYEVKPGESFKKGQVLVDSNISRGGVFSPGIEALVAYQFYKYNYEDAITLSQDFAYRSRSYKPAIKEVTLDLQADLYSNVGAANYYQYVAPGTKITEYSILTKGEEHQQVKRKIFADEESGIFFHAERVDDSNYIGRMTSKKYRLYLLQMDDTQEGDKFAGRHANKGVTAKIVKTSEMPTLKNGVPIDALLNPAGVPSRMNLGQILEAHTGFIATLLDIRISTPPFNGATVEVIGALLQYVWDLANKDNIDAVFAEYSWIPSEVHEAARENMDYIKTWKGCFNPDGSADLWDPVTEKYFEFPITIGFSTLLKLEQEVDTKFHARGGLLDKDIEYNAITGQPTQGGHCGGQRAGEADLHALMAYGASAMLEEELNQASDNLGARSNMWAQAADLSERVPEEYCNPKSLEQFMYLLEAVGVRLEGDGLPDISLQASMQKFDLNLQEIIRREIGGGSASESEVTTDDLMKGLYNI